MQGAKNVDKPYFDIVYKVAKNKGWAVYSKTL